MIKKPILLSALLLVSSYTLANDSTKTTDLRYEKGFLSMKYLLGNKTIGRKTFKSHISSNAEALDTFNKSNLPYYSGSALAILGGAAVGAAFGTAQGKDESVDTSVVGGGFALIGLAIFIIKSADKHMTNSIDIFNASSVSFSPDSSRYRKVRSNLFFTQSQIGLSMSF